MTKTPQRRGRVPARKRSGRRVDAWSVAIPIVVGVVLLAVIVGAIVLSENTRAGSGSVAGDPTLPVTTVQPLPTQPIPYFAVLRVSIEDAVSRLEQGRAVLIDVRSSGSYDQSHAAGALSFPEDEILTRLGELPRDRELILYCT